jgi:hypothetical protein
VVAWLSRDCGAEPQRHAADVRDLQSAGANTKKARFTGPQTTRQWYRPNPMTGEADWSIRDSINYSETAVLTALELTSRVPAMVVENFYRKSLNAVGRGTAKAPYAFVIPAGRAIRQEWIVSPICCGCSRSKFSAQRQRSR